MKGRMETEVGPERRRKGRCDFYLSGVLICVVFAK